MIAALVPIPRGPLAPRLLDIVGISYLPSYGCYGDAGSCVCVTRFGWASCGGWRRLRQVCWAGVPILYSARSETIPTRSASEDHNSFPRLRFGLVWIISFQTAQSIKHYESQENL